MIVINKCCLLPAVLVTFRRNRRHKKEKMNSSALNKMNCDRKFLVIIYHFILCMRESIEQNMKPESNSNMLAQ